jgi:hypothetical protein
MSRLGARRSAPKANTMMKIVTFDTTCRDCDAPCKVHTSSEWYTPEELMLRGVRCDACRHRGIRGFLMAPMYFVFEYLARVWPHCFSGLIRHLRQSARNGMNDSEASLRESEESFRKRPLWTQEQREIAGEWLRKHHPEHYRDLPTRSVVSIANAKEGGEFGATQSHDGRGN